MADETEAVGRDQVALLAVSFLSLQSFIIAPPPFSLHGWTLVDIVVAAVVVVVFVSIAAVAATDAAQVVSTV